MAEGYNYQLLTAIVKVIRPNGKPVLGVADGQGQFMWLPTDKIIMSHPMQYDNWQTTIFALDSAWKIIWKAEQKWEDFKGSYPSNTKPIIQPIPPIFQGAPAQTATAPAQQPVQQTTATQPANYPIPTITAVPQVPQVPQVLRTIPIIPTGLSTTPTISPDINIEIIAAELKNIRQLLELFIKPAKLTTADQLIPSISQNEVIQQYGAPPDSNPISQAEAEINSKPNINKEKLPDIFGD